MYVPSLSAAKHVFFGKYQYLTKLRWPLMNCCKTCSAAGRFERKCYDVHFLPIDPWICLYPHTVDMSHPNIPFMSVRTPCTVVKDGRALSVCLPHISGSILNVWWSTSQLVNSTGGQTLIVIVWIPPCFASLSRLGNDATINVSHPFRKFLRAARWTRSSLKRSGKT